MATWDEAKEIIKNTPISYIVGLYHPVNKKGTTYEALCPFHADTHPSLKLNDTRGIYKCFACGAVGDAIKFVQDKNQWDFKTAFEDISTQL